MLPRRLDALLITPNNDKLEYLEGYNCTNIGAEWFPSCSMDHSYNGKKGTNNAHDPVGIGEMFGCIVV